jgi:hypothetical protein
MLRKSSHKSASKSKSNGHQIGPHNEGSGSAICRVEVPKLHSGGRILPMLRQRGLGSAAIWKAPHIRGRATHSSLGKIFTL